MADETTFELVSVQFGAEPVAVFRFGYERFELRALMRILGGSIGIAILQTQLSQNTQIVHSRLIRAPAPGQPARPGAIPDRTVQSYGSVRYRRAKSRGHPPGGNGRL